MLEHTPLWMKSRKGAVVCLCLRKTPFPFPASRTGQADFPHPALPQGLTATRPTAFAAFALPLRFARVSITLDHRLRPTVGQSPAGPSIGATLEASLTEALSLHRRYPASTLL